MALMGLLEPVYRLPHVPARRRQPGPDRKGAGERWACSGACRLQAEIERLFDEKPAAYTDDHFRLFAEFKAALNEGRDPRRRAGRRLAHRLARQRLGQERHPARLPHGRRGRHVDRREPPAVLRQVHLPGEALDRGQRRAHRARRLQHSRRLLHRQRRHLHAAHVHQRGRVRGRWHHGRFARAGRKLRAGRQELPHLGRQRRSAACWSRWARCR